MSKSTLTQPQRIFVALFYLIVLGGIFVFLGGSLKTLVLDASNDKSLWFYSGALLIILGNYIAEPFFTKPTDSLANSLAVIIALIGLDAKESLFGYHFILILSTVILVLTLVSIGLKDSKGDVSKWFSKNSYWITVNLGSSKILFSLIFLSSIYSYMALTNPPDVIGFVVLVAFWINIMYIDIAGKVMEFFLRFKEVNKSKTYELGKAIGCENPLLYKVEINNEGTGNAKNGKLVTVENTKGIKSVGVIINSRQLLNKKWLSIYLITDEKKNLIKVGSDTSWFGSKSILKPENAVYIVNSPDEFNERIVDKIKKSFLFQNKENFIGYVEGGSNLNTLKFHVLNSNATNNITEGSILSVDVNYKKTLFQVIDGQTREEHLENQDNYGYTVGIARKLGFYKMDKNELEVVSWMPEMFTAVYNHIEEKIDEVEIKQIAEESIGRLPRTKYQIPIKDINSLVTHNTAILGILGIGKSCLTFELLKKAHSEIQDLKIICIDITNEYGLPDKLPAYISNDEIVVDTPQVFTEIDDKIDYIETIGDGSYAKQIPDKSGNINDYRKSLKKDLLNFLFETEEIPKDYEVSKNKRVRIYNPDYHKVTKGEKMGIHVLTPALSPAEKTKVITEETLKILMKFPPVTNNTAKVLFVFEEAHSLVPEWNSVSNDGDKTAVNGTAKVILQGRKYGLGSLVVTQRTANISKSILNQCNTVFALRVFDDTGKQFLENYIGSDYSNTLPTLEERHAIAVGKALKLKQPVIIQLNDMKHVINKED